MADSVFKSILDAAHAAVVALDLPDIGRNVKVIDHPPDKIEDVLLNKQQGRLQPGILIIGGTDLQTDESAGTNARDDIGYPIVIGIFGCRKPPDCKSQYTAADEGRAFDRAAMWEERVRRIFHNNINWAACLPSVYHSYVEREVHRDDNLRRMRHLDAKTIFVRAISREARC